ncbi:MAG: hypothetical protein WBQ94_23715 [Terracidiphilus sp.]
MNDLPVTLDQLTARLESLEQRVDQLEHPESAVTKPAAPFAHPSGDAPSTIQTAGFFAIAGRAMLGIAGAYVLRAVAESSALPRIAVAVLAIAYALTWMVWAARAKAGAFPSVIYASTSALILAPMLWELTLRFGVLSPSAAAAILAVFVLAATALAWQRNVSTLFWIADLTAAIAALALSIATRRFIPFLAVLLLMAFVAEVASACKRAYTLRPFVAAAVDLTIWVYFFIYSGPSSARVDYPAPSAASLLTPACLLFVLYAASIAIRTVMLRHTISVFETIQSAASFALAAFSLLTFTPQSGSILLGSVCLFLAAASYALVYIVAHRSDADCNQQVFATFATAFLTIGGLLCLPPISLALTLSLAAFAATFLGVRLNRASGQVHGLLLLVTAAIASGLLDYDLHSLAGTLPNTLSIAACIAAVFSLACYAAARPLLGETRLRQSLRLIPAALAACTLAALLVQAVLALVALRIVPGVHHIAFLRTFSLCAVALALAYAGVRTRRPELTQITYAALAFVGAKLIFEDLRHGHFEFIAASIFLFAISLMIVPRLPRMGQTI